MELENTGEYNRNFRLLNGAGLDPYHEQPIPNQQPLDAPRDESEEDWSHLDGQEYQPAPHIEPDTRTGFSMDGNYHAVESFTQEGLAKAITPFRWRDYLQDAITQYASTHDYTLGASERDDLAQDIVSERMEACDTMLERYQLEKALELWREMYGRGYKIRP